MAGAGALILALTCLLVVAPQAASAAECATTTTTVYPPSGSGSSLQKLVLEKGHLPPGTVTGTITIGNADAGEFCGTLFSTPVGLPSMASSGGKLVYQGLAVPSDFKLNAAHHIDVYKTGALVGSFDFCVNKDADIVALNSKTCATATATDHGALPKTGADRVWEIVRAAMILLVIGAMAVYARRRIVANRTA
jgi:hypothetical protein